MTTAPVVAKVARPGTAHLPHIIALVHWLIDHGVPTVPLVEGIAQPITAHGLDVTFWRYLPQRRPILASDIARPLAQLHQTP